MGILRVRGTIDLAQFWPTGSADADTAKILVTVNPNSFAFAADDKTFKTTKVFFGARARGKTSKPVIDTKSRITCRLQGIDAPELHYKASPLPSSSSISAAKRKAYNAGNPERRQHWAESATVALAQKLKNFGTTTIKCEFVSRIDEPRDIVDTYGRFVGNIRVGTGFNLDINVWLTEEGWVYPAFYLSMSKNEVNEYLVAMKKGKTKNRIWKDYSKNTGKFENKLLYRKGGPAGAIGSDKGDVLMPKIYRRQVTFRVSKSAKVVSGNFVEFLKKTNYQYAKLDEFLELSLPELTLHPLADLASGNTFDAEPQDVVFKEDKSDLLDKNGKKITKF
jgi:endonuclease YncB( thermonuclease family)